MNPEQRQALRRALHECVDIICDAIAAGEERRGPPKRRRRAPKVHVMPEGVDETTKKRAEAAAKKAGWT